MRRVCYITGTRADFGLMAGTLKRLCGSSSVELGLCVTGMHLSPKYGETVREIEAAGLPILARIPSAVDETTGRAMALAAGETLVGLANALSQWPAQLVLVLGDRGEMLAGAIAATYLGIPITHIHGGERSGSVDEPVRHAISKLSHYHFVATPGARDRLVRMGEAAERVFVTGAPGLDELAEFAPATRAALCRKVSLDADRPISLMVFHPVAQEEALAGDQARAVIGGALQARSQVVALMPNADSGADRIRAVLDSHAGHPDVRVFNHMPRADFLSWLARADAMLGNSSSGIIEAASLGQWVVNVGSRQRMRERSGNVMDVAPDKEQVRQTVASVLGRARRRWDNVYGDGRAAERIAGLLERLPLDRGLFDKINAY